MELKELARKSTGRKKPCLECKHIASDHEKHYHEDGTGGKCLVNGCECNNYRPTIEMGKT